MSTLEDRPFVGDVGITTGAHWYFSFEKNGQLVTFGIPRDVQATVALCACKALLPGWRWIDRDDPGYGQGHSEEELAEFRERFLQALAGTHLTRRSQWVPEGLR